MKIQNIETKRIYEVKKESYDSMPPSRKKLFVVLNTPEGKDLKVTNTTPIKK